MGREGDILRDAIIATDKEIFGDAFGQEETVLDESGDRSLEAMGSGLEGQHEPDDEEEDEPAEGAEQGEAAEAETETSETPEAKAKTEEAPATEQRQDEHQGRVPAGRLREQTERTRAAETERDQLKAQVEAERANSRKEIDALKAQFDGVLAALRQQQPTQQPKATEPPKPEAPPDLLENPTAFAEYVRKGGQTEAQALRQEMAAMRVETSLQVAHARHGDTFQAAFDAVKQLDPNNQENRDLVRRMYAAPNPGEALVQWHKRNEALKEVGDDPAKYRERIAEDTRKALMADPEFRKQIIDELRGEAMAGDHGRPRTVTRLPGSLNRAAGGNTRAPNDLAIFDGSDQAVFDSAFHQS
ncbi:MAG: hypothetical protein JO107_16125 [Hyphomicrobiales bacterium]|nr:hypothetical protein [Hyphomicrobiales bacterium]